MTILETSACLNCHAALTGPFCAQCGQKAAGIDLTLGEFLRETTQELTDLDGKVPGTLRALFLRPGILTRDFLAGRRARWLPPLRLYLICSLAYFLSGPLVEAITHREVREVARITVKDSKPGEPLTAEERSDLEKSGLTRLIGRERIERALANPKQLNDLVLSAFPKAMFVLLPLFALLTNLAWRRKLPRYPAHLYVALHLHAAWFGGFALAKLAGMVSAAEAVQISVAAAAFGYLVWYGLVALRRIFEDSWGKTIAKTAGIALVYGFCFVVVSIGMLGWAVARM